MTPRPSPEATDLHRDAVVVDCHNDLILLVARKRVFGPTGYFGQHWIPELRAGGVDVQVIPIYIELEYAGEGALRRTLLLIDALWREVETVSEQAAICGTGAEIDAAVAAGKIAFVLALEGCEAIGRDVELFAPLHRLGVRMASFTHFGRTALADGSAEDATGGRLTRTGVAALREMERLGILMDVSHLSMAGVEHVLSLATRPLIASHSSARALCDHHRNLNDDQIRGIAATGGVVGVSLVAPFTDATSPTIDRVVDHVEHVAAVAGIDHVGIGPDFVREYIDEVYPQYPDLRMEGLDPRATIPGLSTPRELPALTEAMLRRGMRDADVRKVLGENFLRVFQKVFNRAKPD